MLCINGNERPIHLRRCMAQGVKSDTSRTIPAELVSEVARPEAFARHSPSYFLSVEYWVHDARQLIKI